MKDDGTWLALGAAAVFAAGAALAPRRRRSAWPSGWGSVNVDPRTPCSRCGSRAGTPQDTVQPTLQGPAAKIMGRGMARRRFMPLYWLAGKPDTKWPMVGSTPGHLTIFDFLGPIELELTGGPICEPRLRLSEPVQTRTGAGKLITTDSVRLFSTPDKMDAPSFSLPAGPPPWGGTCVGARLVPGAGILSETTGEFVCASCYALKNRYMHHAIAFSQGIRLRWVLQQLGADRSGNALANAFTESIDTVARITRARKPADRQKLEFGVWRNGRIMVPGTCGAAQLEARSTRLPAPFGSSRRVIGRLGPQNGDVAGYWRWLDSGDVNVGTKVPEWIGFIRALGAVGRAFPRVLFWLPTRSAFVPQVAKVLAAETRRTSNLVVRPSAFTTCQPPPVIRGLAAGTTVIDTQVGTQAQRASEQTDAQGRSAWGCPAYLGGKTATCVSSHCRTCWVRPDVPVWYPLH